MKFRGFGIPLPQRVSRTEEGLEVLRRCFAGERFYSRFFAESGQGRSWYRDGDRIPQTWVVGDVEHCVRELSQFIAEHGITDLVTWAVPPGLRPEHMNASLERFARDVAPRLKAVRAQT